MARYCRVSSPPYGKINNIAVVWVFIPKQPGIVVLNSISCLLINNMLELAKI